MFGDPRIKFGSRFWAYRVEEIGEEGLEVAKTLLFHGPGLLGFQNTGERKIPITTVYGVCNPEEGRLTKVRVSHKDVALWGLTPQEALSRYLYRSLKELHLSLDTTVGKISRVKKVRALINIIT